MDIVLTSLSGTKDMEKLRPNLGKTGRMKLSLLAAQDFLQKLSSQVKQLFPEMEIPCGERRRTSASTPPELRRAVRKAHRGMVHPATTKFLRTLRLGGATTASLDAEDCQPCVLERCSMWPAWRKPGCPKTRRTSLRGREVDSPQRARNCGGGPGR